MALLVPLGALYPAYLAFKWADFEGTYRLDPTEEGAASLSWVWAAVVRAYFALCLLWRLVCVGVYHKLRTSLGLHLARSVEVSRRRPLPFPQFPQSASNPT